MRFGYVISPERGGTDALLGGLARELIARGLPVAGAVQVNSDCGGAGACQMDLQILPQGPVFRISQTLGAGSQGCRLDPAGLEAAVAAVAPTLGAAQVVILNKFGKHEAEGRGFRDLIGLALEQGLPVIVGVNHKNRDAFVRFAAGLADPVDATPDALLHWALDGVPA